MISDANDTRVKIAKAVWELVDALSKRDRGFLMEIFSRSRVEELDAFKTLDDLGENYCAPPNGTYENIYIQKNLDAKTYDVVAEFWEKKTGESDLSVEVLAEIKDNLIILKLNDIRPQ